METHVHRPTHLQRALQRLAATAWAGWLLSRTLHYIDRPLMRLTRGRVSLPGLIIGLPVLALTTTGAKSGIPRTVPLVYIAAGDNIVLIASYFGSDRHPAWYRNLCAHPTATVALDGHTANYVARELHGAERERYWRAAVSLYCGYAAYERRARGRIIPVVLLTPQAKG